MILTPTPVSSDRFSFSRHRLGTQEIKLCTADISDLGPGFQFQPVYDDALDTGLAIVSAKTGKIAVFAMGHIEVRAGETLWWELTCITRGLTHLRVKLFND